MEIEIKSISPFKGHPFKVIADDKMEELINSVKESGVITPVLLRPAEKISMNDIRSSENVCGT